MNLRRFITAAALLLAFVLLPFASNGVGLVTQSGPKLFTSSSSSSSSGGGGACSDCWFVANFTTPGGSMAYNFEERRSYSNTGDQMDGVTNYTLTHLPTGGRYGGPAVRAVYLTGRYQYQAGWRINPAHQTWVPGMSRFTRFTMRIDNDVRWNSDNAIKLIDDRGEDGGGERTILYYKGRYNLSSGGGTLGWQVNVDSTGWPDSGSQNLRTLPPWFGLSGSVSAWDNAPLLGEYGALTLNNEIGFRASDPVILSYGNKTSPGVTPNSTSQALTSGWLDVQYEQYCTTTNQIYFRVWLNNNTQASPSAVNRVYNVGSEAPGLDCTGWNSDQWVLGAYVDGGTGAFNEQDHGIVYERFEQGPTFRNDWFRGVD